MSASYSYTKTVYDQNVLFAYVKNTFPTATNLSYDGTNLKLYFSASLTVGEQTTLSTLITNYPDPKTVEDSENANLSVFNTTSVALGAGAAFTGSWEDVARYSCLRVSVLSNVASAVGGLSIQFGIASAQADHSTAYSTTAAVPLDIVSDIRGRYFRLVYTNGVTLQTSFSLTARWSSGNEPLCDQLNSVQYDQTDAPIVKSIMAGRNDLGNYRNVRVDERNMLRVKAPKVFDREEIFESSPWIQIPFVYGILTDIVTTTVVSTGTVTLSSTRAAVATAAVNNSSAAVTTNKRCVCDPGGSVFACVSVTFGTATTGNTQICGAGDAVNGFFFGYNGTAFGILTRYNSVSTWVTQASWNVDKLDGTGPSGILLNPQYGNTYAIRYDTLGYGYVTFLLLACDAATDSSDFLVVHRKYYNNAAATVAITIPSLPLTVANTNGATTAVAVTMYVASMFAHIDSNWSNARINQYASTIATGNNLNSVNCMFLFAKTTLNTISTTNMTILLSSLTLTCTAPARGAYLSIIKGPTLTGTLGTYTDIDTVNSPMQWVAAGTAAYTASSGTVMFVGICSTEQTFDLTQYAITVTPGIVYLFLVRNLVSGAGSITASVTWKEM
jgi:hypothetical protein